MPNSSPPSIAPERAADSAAPVRLDSTGADSVKTGPIGPDPVTVDPVQVCAVVVTFNRKTMLEECLQALLTQSRPVDTILVVDNNSTDGTLEMVREHFPQAQFPQVRILALETNSGGAGGFHAGLEWAHRHGFDWFWLLDDDTMAHKWALESLLNAHQAFPAERRPKLLASRVLWTDHTIHPMNITIPSYVYLGRMRLARHRGMVSIRAASFVSLLVAREGVTKYGLTCPDYFIWNDDAEFTARVSRHELAVLVPDSKAVHKTVNRYMPLTSSGARFYYEVRNKLWMVHYGTGWTLLERLCITGILMFVIFMYLSNNRFSKDALAVVRRGWHDAWHTQPGEVEFPGPAEQTVPPEPAKAL
jgi:rhamnopyranosyl-N-acetylglucosaminyl-diphospho-decaprenol beta-1,3/1,4-galactofuranosyltransferase